MTKIKSLLSSRKKKGIKTVVFTLINNYRFYIFFRIYRKKILKAHYLISSVKKTLEKKNLMLRV